MLFYTLGVGEYTASLVCYVFFVHYFLSLIPALFQVYPRPCIKYASTELGVSNSLIQRILNEPKWHATTVHYMISTNKEHRVTLCSMVLKTCRRRLKKTLIAPIHQNLHELLYLAKTAISGATIVLM